MELPKEPKMSEQELHAAIAIAVQNGDLDGAQTWYAQCTDAIDAEQLIHGVLRARKGADAVRVLEWLRQRCKRMCNGGDRYVAPDPMRELGYPVARDARAWLPNDMVKTIVESSDEFVMAWLNRHFGHLGSEARKDIGHWMCLNQVPKSKYAKAIFRAAELGRAELLRWMFRDKALHKHFTSIAPAACSVAALGSRMDIVRWFESAGLYPKDGQPRFACDYDQEMLYYRIRLVRGPNLGWQWDTKTSGVLADSHRDFVYHALSRGVSGMADDVLKTFVGVNPKRARRVQDALLAFDESDARAWLLELIQERKNPSADGTAE